MAQIFDVVIVGAGIVGTACALELAAAGLAVAVIERDTIGSGATAASMGHIVVMDDSPAQLQLTRYAQLLWDAQVADAPERHEYVRCGTIWLAADAEELAAASQKQDLYAAHAIPSELLDPPALYAREPNLRPGLAGGLLVPGDGALYPPRSAALLVERAKQHALTVLRGHASQLVAGGVRLASGAIVRGASLVVANGACAVDLIPQVPLRAKKGHLAITDRAPGFVRHQLVELGYIKNAHASHGDSVAFNVQPRSTGQLLIGSSRQFDSQSSAIEYPLLAAMLARSLAYLPALERLACLRVWTGVRAATPDGLPLIGPLPGQPDVWLATGHEGLGITTALATARLLAAQMLGRRPEIPIAPYLPARLMPAVAYA